MDYDLWLFDEDTLRAMRSFDTKRAALKEVARWNNIDRFLLTTYRNDELVILMEQRVSRNDLTTGD